MANERGEDLFPRLNKEKFRAELLKAWEEGQRRAARQRGEDPDADDGGGDPVREPRRPPPYSPTEEAVADIDEELIPEVS